MNLEVSARSPPYTQPVTAGRRLADTCPSQTQRKRLVRQPGAGWTPADPQLVAAGFERMPGRPHSQP
ncbi:uncharacterized protein HVO_A0408A (plasmid) [Haloferax volcanii DS2]|uniref:Uncharacterized protein n=1 Tax=Haloferax volcanii (strain ATCC 29605 / DSM 3757 / JCM 8879 / NBRC 14742 / NCIMB 2012 / VKM B-1768 / DS2) TaxID=309800 RepID=A0A1C9J6W4_HALVD|nr:uncharacterized protein HVO_A0408A [Haloferax volcanii DS2]